MDHDAFVCLYLHAHSFAELGRTRFADLAAADDAGSAPLDSVLGQESASAPGMDDFDAYLSRLYAGRAAVADRIDAIKARLSPDELGQLAEGLSVQWPQLPSLLAPLDGKGLSDWLDLYAQGDENLHDIVQRIRCADA